MPSSCGHVDDVRDDWAAVPSPVCEECVRMGSTWVSLRRCLTCGRIGCCDSSPNRHATAHYHQTSHPIVRTLQPGQDWAWCYVDEISMRHQDRGWVELDIFFEAGLAFMREHLESGGDPDLDEAFLYWHGFPLGQWLAEMRRRRAAGQLTADQAADFNRLPGLRVEV